MDKRMRFVLALGILIFVLVLGLSGYFLYRNVAWVDTLHARVVGTVVEVQALGNGRIVDMPTEVGDTVMKDEELATLELIGTAGNGLGRVLVPIKAPITGVVVDKRVHAGDFCAPGQRILTLVDPSEVWILASVHETKIAHVKVGQPVRVRVRALKVSLPGRVEQISQVTTAALGQASVASINPFGGTAIEVPVKISVDTKGYRLYPGMSVDVRIQVDPAAVYLEPEF